MSDFRVGFGYDLHTFNKNESHKNLLLGGVIIPYKYSLKGHSDADVVLHALVDAILGALALGDIGDFFPPTDNKWKNMDSKVFVAHAMESLHKKKYHICNIDFTILAEEPKLMDYKLNIKKNICALLNIDNNQCNVKATTSEKVGYIGRKEAIACYCNILIEKN